MSTQHHHAAFDREAVEGARVLIVQAGFNPAIVDALRTGTVAVITPFIDRWFFSTVLSGISDVLQESDVDLLVYEVGDPATSPVLPAARRLRGRVDGVIVVTLPTDAPRIADMLEIGLPTSFIGVRWPGVPSVCIDDADAGRMATQHLLNLGHERIGIISGRPRRPPRRWAARAATSPPWKARVSPPTLRSRPTATSPWRVASRR